ncbi:MAG: hypothetical protein LBE83_07740 [Propionibacteriaceae bacterium]|jgi:carbamoyl-phosphate synthase small subunit|nr:hypothetical protein [Propionibacteriaceae bacterium]
MNTPAILVFEDGRTFIGTAFGAPGEVYGGAVFDTSLHYQRALTDPRHHAQVVISTTPHIGNVGWVDADAAADAPTAIGYVVRDPAPRPSSWRADRPLADELTAQGIVGIAGVDTRAITRHLRDRGPLRAGISTIDLNPDSLLAKLRASIDKEAENA